MSTYTQHVLDVWASNALKCITFSEALHAYCNAPSRDKPYRPRHTSTSMTIGKILHKHGVRHYVEVPYAPASHKTGFYKKPVWIMRNKLLQIAEPDVKKKCICGGAKRTVLLQVPPDGVGHIPYTVSVYWFPDCLGRVWISSSGTLGERALLSKFTVNEAELLTESYYNNARNTAGYSGFGEFLKRNNYELTG